jgi:hypothetical protein
MHQTLVGEIEVEARNANDAIAVAYTELGYNDYIEEVLITQPYQVTDITNEKT